MMGPLKNGDVGRPCEGKYENGNKCKRTAYQLSSTDKRIGLTLGPIQPITRTIRYKCAGGHRFDKDFRMEINLLAAPKKEVEDV